MAHDPRCSRRFPSRDVAAIIREVFKGFLDDNPEYNQELGNSIAREIRARLKGETAEPPARAARSREGHLGVGLRLAPVDTCCSLIALSALPELELPRYKFMVQVIVGENSGEGVRVGTRCLWDASTDGMAHESMASVSAGSWPPWSAASSLWAAPPL